MSGKVSMEICKEGLEPLTGLDEKELAAAMGAFSTFVQITLKTKVDPTGFVLRVTKGVRHACLTIKKPEQKDERSEAHS